MAIRVVSEGPTYEFQIACKSCGYQIAFQENDVKYGSSTSYDGSSDSHSYLKCPKCSVTIYVTTRKMQRTVASQNAKVEPDALDDLKYRIKTLELRLKNIGTRARQTDSARRP